MLSVIDTRRTPDYNGIYDNDYYPCRFAQNRVTRSGPETRFLHLVLFLKEGWGWQVKLKGPDGAHIQPYYSAFKYGSLDRALKQALIGRNFLYRQFGYPSSLLYGLQSLSVPSERTSTGYAGVYLRYKHDSRRGTGCEVIAVHYRRTDNRAGATKEWKLSDFGSPTAAIAHAREWRDDKVDLYNAIAARANTWLIEHRIAPAAAREVETLTAGLHEPPDPDGVAWERALRAMTRGARPSLSRMPG
jgi:hypothetical protein